MTDKELNTVEQVLDGFHVGYAYLYPFDGENRQEYVFDMTAENIANFIGSHQLDASKIIITDMLDRLILNASGCSIDICSNQKLCNDVVSKLTAIQKGECVADEFPIVDRKVFEEYVDMEEESVMRAEISML